MQLSCAEDPSCGRVPSSVTVVTTTPAEDEYLTRCAEEPGSDEIASSRLGVFTTDVDPTNLDVFSGTAQIYARSRALNSFSCTRADGSNLFELEDPSNDPGPMRIQPAAGNGSFYATLLNRVEFQELPIQVPVFAPIILDQVVEDLGVELDETKGTVVIEVLEPPGFFDIAGFDAGLAVPARPRHAGSSFDAADAEVVAYRVDGYWRTDVSETSTEGLAVIVNVPASVGLGSQFLAVQEEAEGSSLERHLWAAAGAITFAAMPPAL